MMTNKNVLILMGSDVRGAMIQTGCGRQAYDLTALVFDHAIHIQRQPEINSHRPEHMHPICVEMGLWVQRLAGQGVCLDCPISSR
jgi:hypothetical protein